VLGAVRVYYLQVFQHLSFFKNWAKKQFLTPALNEATFAIQRWKQRKFVILERNELIKKWWFWTIYTTPHECISRRSYEYWQEIKLKETEYRNRQVFVFTVKISFFDTNNCNRGLHLPKRANTSQFLYFFEQFRLFFLTLFVSANIGHIIRTTCSLQARKFLL